MLITDCNAEPDVCCVDLYAIAAHLLSSSFDALAPCFAGLPCAPLSAYVTLGAGDDGVADSLTVEVGTTEAASTGVGARTLPLPLVRATFTVRLRESGWPTVSVGANGQVFAPDPVAQNSAARQAVAHGEKLYRNLLFMHAQRRLIPSEVRGCGQPSIGPLIPMPPRGGVVGWSTTITVDVPFGGG